MLINQTIASNVKAFRTKEGLTQEQAAHASGIRRMTWADIENGKGNPRLSTLMVIAYTLGVGLQELFNDKTISVCEY